MDGLVACLKGKGKEKIEAVLQSLGEDEAEQIRVKLEAVEAKSNKEGLAMLDLTKDPSTDAQKVLNHHRPFILCEVLNTTEDYPNYCRILSENNYIKYLITDINIKLYDKIIPHEKFKDWLFIPKEKTEDVLLLMPK